MARQLQDGDAIRTFGQTPQGNSVGMPLSGRVDGSTNPLGVAGVWRSAWLFVDQYIGVATTLYSDQPGSYTLEYSEDGINTGPMPSVTIQYTQTGQSRKGSFSPSAKYIRFTYTNGPTAQTKFVFNIDLNETQTQTSNETLNAAGADTRTAMWTKSRIETKTSDATNDYAPVYRNGNALRVYVDNPSTSPATQAVTGTVTATQGTSPWVVNLPARNTVPIYGSLASSAATANQVVKTYTVPTGKTFYLVGFSMSVQVGALASLLGIITNIGETSLYIGGTSGQKLWGDYYLASSVPPQPNIVTLPVGLPFTAGTTIGMYVTPASTTAFTWRTSIFGYEQ